jgi:sulfite reductase (NADPH) flavoprotein alpha-component
MPGKAYTKKNPFLARIARQYDLTSAQAPKRTVHYEIDLRGSGIEFTPGDSLALQPQNDPALVGAVLEQLGLRAETPTGDDGAKPLGDALLTEYSITTPGRRLMEALAQQDPRGPLAQGLLAEGKNQDLQQYLWGRDVLDLLREHPAARFDAPTFVATLGKLNPRLYSIASSLAAYPESSHLAIAIVRYTAHGRARGGVATTWLAERVKNDTAIPCFITPGKSFRLPEPSDATPILMIGPGTGIAPFRAFLQERKASGAQGDAWLFFGETHRAHAYFYREEFEGYLQSGVLKRLDTAFSRDQEQKIYVQHRLLEHGAEVWRWLERGAIVYVCGDAQRMAVDVDNALRAIVAQHGGRSADDAAAYVQALDDAKRYRKDVY